MPISEIRYPYSPPKRPKVRRVEVILEKTDEMPVAIDK